MRVLANVEGDDAVRGFANPSQNSYVQTPWWEYADRRGQLKRILRGAATPNDGLWGERNITSPLDQDDSAEAERYAQRMRTELEIRRHSGQVVIPWLVRDGEAAWLGYKPGDEVLGVKTARADTFMPLRGSLNTDQPSPRVIGLTYRCSSNPDEQSTVLHLEQRMYGPADVIGPPGVEEVT